MRHTANRLRVINRPLAFLYLCAALFSCTFHREPFCLNDSSAGVEVFITSQAWHSGIAIPVDERAARFIPEINDFAGERYVEIGWGDQDYYMGHKTGFWGGLAALFFSQGSVIQIVGFSSHPGIEFKNEKQHTLRLSSSQYLGLLQHLGSQFDRAGGLNAEALGPGLYGKSIFYRAKGKFGVSRTCHTWLRKSLEAAGCGTSGYAGLF